MVTALLMAAIVRAVLSGSAGLFVTAVGLLLISQYPLLLLLVAVAGFTYLYLTR